MIVRIPLAKPEITESDIAAVTEVLRGTILSFGPKLTEFEEAICVYTGSPFAVAVNSGTSALHLAMKVLNIPEGSEVILPSFAFVAPLNVILQERLKPVFIDIDSRTFNVTADAVEQAITTRTKAIVAIHTFGRPVEMQRLRSIADSKGIALIEDACEALGSEVGGKKAGNWGDVGALAFYPNKQITAGEGGMLLTRDGNVARRARRMRNQGRDSSLNWYQHAELGYSYRLSEMNCALGSEQLRRIESTIHRRQVIADMYESKLHDFPDVIISNSHEDRGRISWFCYVIQFTEWIDRTARDWIAESLLVKGIGTGRYFAPLHRQPLLRGSAENCCLPVTDFVADRALALPFFNQMTEQDVQDICDALRESLDEVPRRIT